MKATLAIALSLIFLNLIVAPTVMSLVYGGDEISYVVDISEEENKNGKEVAENLKIKICTAQKDVRLLYNEIQKRKNIHFKSKNYTSLDLKYDTPPPEKIS